MDRGAWQAIVHGILQARILEWVAMPSSGRSSQPRDWTQVSSIAGSFFTIWGTRETPVHTGKSPKFMWLALLWNIYWKDWCWSSNTLATRCEELTHLKKSWCWERLKAGGEGDDRGWDGWMASLTQWTWVWVNSGSWWWTGRPGMLHPWGPKESDMTRAELNWTALVRYSHNGSDVELNLQFLQDVPQQTDLQ